MNASRASFLHAVGVLGLGATAGLTAAARADAPAAPFALRVASAPDDDITPVLYAQQAGWFGAAGLTVTVEAASSGTAVAAAVAGGAVNIGKASLLSIILAHARGVPFTIVAPSAVADVHGDYSGLLVRSDSPIRTGRDLNGKIVSVPALNDMQSLATHAWIDANGGDSRTVSFLEVPGTSVGLALDADRIAAGLLSNPVLARDLATGKYRRIGKPIEETFNRRMIAAYVADGGWVGNNVAVVRSFGRVVVQASTFANAHHDQTADVMAQFSGVDRATIATMTRAEYATSLDPAAVQSLIDAAAKYGAIHESFPASELISPVVAPAAR
jgi:NitT/TauT family transport system substrate-binding protein